MKFVPFNHVGQDPATDFRGFGVLGLDCLVYFATMKTDVWRQLIGNAKVFFSKFSPLNIVLFLARNEARGSEREYPVATAGVRILFFIVVNVLF